MVSEYEILMFIRELYLYPPLVPTSIDFHEVISGWLLTRLALIDKQEVGREYIFSFRFISGLCSKFIIIT